MNKTEQYNYLRTVLLKQQAPFTQKDTGRARARARCKCGAVNQVNEFSAKSLILVVSRTGFEPVTH